MYLLRFTTLISILVQVLLSMDYVGDVPSFALVLLVHL